MSVPLIDDTAKHIERLVHAALDATDPEAAVTRHLALEKDTLVVGSQRLPISHRTRVRLVAMGKAATPMARGALAALGTTLWDGVVVHPEGELAPVSWPSNLRRLPGGHPLPNEHSIAAGRELQTTLARTSVDDIVVVLISGGGSAMVELPVPGVSLQDIAATTLALQRAGANIREINCVRCMLSSIKGGGLLELAGAARVVGLLLSDVVGDDPAVIASGPIVPANTCARDALEVLDRYALRTELALIQSIAPTRRRSMTAGPAALAIVGSNSLASQAVQRCAAVLGFQTRIVDTSLSGEASEIGRAIAVEGIREKACTTSPLCLIYGGETTVTVRGSGRGGRNQELALGAAVALQGTDHIVICSFATDGIDGLTTAAGAIASGHTLQRAAVLGLSAERSLADNDSGAFFAALGDAIVTGPTGTNVNDLTLVLIYATGPSSAS